VIRADTTMRHTSRSFRIQRTRSIRARNGEVGLTESWALAETIDEVVSADTALHMKRAVVAVVDLPSQAYGRIEEMAGLHHAIAAAVDAYHRARNAGHPTVRSWSGRRCPVHSSLTVCKPSRYLRSTTPAFTDFTPCTSPLRPASPCAQWTNSRNWPKPLFPLSYHVRDWAQLGFCDGLLPVSDADAPTADDVSAVRHAVDAAIAAARSGPRDLSNRLESPRRPAEPQSVACDPRRHVRAMARTPAHHDRTTAARSVAHRVGDATVSGGSCVVDNLHCRKRLGRSHVALGAHRATWLWGSGAQTDRTATQP